MIRAAMAPIGIVLVHGYLGAPADLAPLAESLAKAYGNAAITRLCLPGHGDTATPPFAEDAMLAVLAAAMDHHLDQGRRLVLIGHSTGGSLLLAEIARRQAKRPDSLAGLLLLALCATPPRIDLGYTQRWGAHSAERAPSLHDLGALVALVNGLARRGPLALPAATLIVHGEEDELVPVADAEQWRRRLNGPLRGVSVPGGRHHLFTGAGAELAVDALRRAIDDARQHVDAATESALCALEPGLQRFCDIWPGSLRHLADSPAAMRALAREFVPTSEAGCEPTLANIEITTRCTLGCGACARTRMKLKSRFMSLADFRRVLERLPHAWRINLVGLGEPLLHPEVIDFIRSAVAAGRRVGLVTNAMNLDTAMARALCASGLASLTFSLDAVDPATAERVRQGSDMALISANIRALVAERKRQGARLSTAAFTALTGATLGELAAIVDFVADHELDALMVTDLNFAANQARSVHASLTPEQARGVRLALKRALARRLPVLSVWGLEEWALDRNYLDYLLLSGKQLAHRSSRRGHCLSPWQTIPVNVDGNLTLCDCQPEAVIGNIHHTPLGEWWNGPAMREQRRCMLSDHPPEACLVCPRF